MIFNLVLNGPKNYSVDLRKYDYKNNIWIGVDSGSLEILNNKLTLNVALGDFDFLNQKQINDIKKQANFFKIYPKEKDETDFEIALNWIVQQKFIKKIRVFNWSFGRIDHFLSVITVLLKPKYEKIRFLTEFIDKQNWLKIFGPGKHIVKPILNMKYLGFSSITNIKNIVLKNYKYELNVRELPALTVLPSNEFLNNKNGYFSFEDGLMFVFQSRDI